MSRGGAKITMTLKGGDELKVKLQEMGSAAKGILVESVEKGAKVLADDIRSRAPGPEIGVEVVKASKYAATANVGPDKSHWYYRFFETGVQPHTITGPLAFQGRDGEVVIGGVDHPGMAARPFMRPAFDSKQDRARDVLGQTLRDELLRRAR
jgi:HK97 gp10 family phage protein